MDEWKPVGNMQDGDLALTKDGELYVLISRRTVVGEIQNGIRAGIMLAPLANVGAGKACAIMSDALCRTIAAGSKEHRDIISKDRFDRTSEQIAEELERLADNGPDEIVDKWLKLHGFAAMNETINGRRAAARMHWT